MAIPALARRLDDDSPYYSLLLENIGNIGTTNDEEVFRSVITVLLTGYGGAKNIHGVAQTLAKVPGRPYPLLEMYLIEVLKRFIDKASTLPQNSVSCV